MYINIWEFKVCENCTDKFVRMNTEDWPEFFRLGRTDYLGTEIGRNIDDQRIYVVVDRWSSKAAFRRFIEEHRDGFDTLDSLHAEIYEFVRHAEYNPDS